MSSWLRWCLPLAVGFVLGMLCGRPGLWLSMDAPSVQMADLASRTLTQTSRTLTADLAEAVRRVAREDEAIIDALFATHDCQHVYLDVGSNIGVQVRKLFEPQLFPAAKVLRIFDRFFGPAPRCHVCAIGFEPSLLHQERLRNVSEHLSAAGAGVVFIEAAAATMDSTMSFFKGDINGMERYNSPGASAVHGEWFKSLEAQFRRDHEEAHLQMARAVDLNRVVTYVDAKLRARNPSAGRGRSHIVMKLDIESSEYEVLQHLIVGDGLCMINATLVEYHPESFNPDWQKKWSRSAGMFFQDKFGDARKNYGDECRVNVSVWDDETYGFGEGSSPPWPTASVC